MRNLTEDEKAELDDLVSASLNNIFEQMQLEDEEHEVAIIEYVINQLDKELATAKQ